jgi:acetyl esterase/lipase
LAALCAGVAMSWMRAVGASAVAITGLGVWLSISALLGTSCTSTTTPMPGDDAYGDHALQKLDMYMPTNNPASAPPVIIYAHGGGWTTEPDAGTSPRKFVPEALLRQRQNGWAVVSISYRGTPEHTAPVPVHDLKRAIRYIRYRGQSSYFGRTLDTNHIVVAGSSAGAHLAAMVAATGSGTMEPSDLPSHLADTSSSVQGAIVWQGPDFSAWRQQSNQYLPRCFGNAYLNCSINGQSTPSDLFGTPCVQPTGNPVLTCGAADYDKATPSQYVSSGAPPISLPTTRPIRLSFRPPVRQFGLHIKTAARPDVSGSI